MYYDYCSPKKEGLRDRNESAQNPQQAANIEMLARLRLDGFIRRDHEQNQGDAADPRQHVSDEALVAGNVDKAKAHAIKLQECEAEVDGDAASLFLLEAIGICARKRLAE